MPSAEDRERRLADANRRYLRGEMTEEQYDTARQADEVDYLGALTALVRFQHTAPRESDAQGS